MELTLFAIEIRLGFKSIKASYKSTAIVIFCKMLVESFLLICILKIFGFEMTPSAIVVVFESAMPTIALARAMAIKTKLDTNLAVSAIAFVVLFAFISMPLLVWILM